MSTDTNARAVELLQEVISLLSNGNPPKPTERVKPDQDQTELIELKGIVDYPSYQEVRGYPLFKFNIGQERIDGRRQWSKCQTWRDTAKWAFENVFKDDEVVVFGQWKPNEWVDKETGELKRNQVFNIVYFGGSKPSE